ncbi:MAG: 2-amino-4-hydroxy-6-hydroxymethyldihydropteridine diphosphokinase [Bacteroidetes bacterium]|nr:2-amino-4-hydroxy-6-hydroxymethyldihydropteridine diphosphokinase [Bacteroidota bacterium]
MGNMDETMRSAISIIHNSLGTVSKISNKFKTEAWGPIEQAPFLNIAIEVKTIFSPQLVLNKILSIEQKLGRKRFKKYGPRTIDIDILFFSNRIISTERLIVPHPQIQFRNFALIPCNEIIPNFTHPGLNKKIKVLLNESQDNLNVKEI